MSLPLVSIVILTYKDFSNLSKALHSCYLQDYENFEIILSDDGSDNFNYEAVSDMFSACPINIAYKILHQDVNEGTVKNYNHALDVATGEYIVSLAGDDTFASNETVSRFVEVFLDSPDCLCVTSRERHFNYDGSSVVLPSPHEENLIISGDCKKLWYQIAAQPCFVVGSATAYMKKVFELFGKFDTDYVLLEDWPLYTKMLEHGYKIGFLPYVTINHSSGGVSTPRGKYRNPLLVRDDIKCLEHVIENADKMKLKGHQKRSLKYRMLCLKNESNKVDTSFLEKMQNFDVACRNKLWGLYRRLSLKLDKRDD